MLPLFGILAFISLHGTISASICNTISTPINIWQQGQDAKFNFFVPTASSSWTIVVTFEEAITTLNTWTGIVVGCVGGTVCTFTNQVKIILQNLFHFYFQNVLNPIK